MDLHKPKPWRGLREFLKEYLIIVVGVLTALAAEALVEELRWAERTHQTEAHLNDTVHGLTAYAAERLAIQPCTNQMLDVVLASLERGDDDWKPPFVFSSPNTGKGVVMPPRRSWLAEDWNAAIADGTANHLPKAKLLAYAKFFQWVGRARTISDREETDVEDLQSLASVRRLDPAIRAHYLQLVYRMRGDNTGLGVYANNLIAAAKNLHVAPASSAEMPSGFEGYRRLCDDFRAGRTNVVFDLKPLKN